MLGQNAAARAIVEERDSLTRKLRIVAQEWSSGDAFLGQDGIRTMFERYERAENQEDEPAA
jgi:hypothetical protein